MFDGAVRHLAGRVCTVFDGVVGLGKVSFPVLCLCLCVYSDIVKLLTQDSCLWLVCVCLVHVCVVMLYNCQADLLVLHCLGYLRSTNAYANAFGPRFLSLRLCYV